MLFHVQQGSTMMGQVNALQTACPVLSQAITRLASQLPHASTDAATHDLPLVLSPLALDGVIRLDGRLVTSHNRGVNVRLRAVRLRTVFRNNVQQGNVPEQSMAQRSAHPAPEKLTFSQ